MDLITDLLRRIHRKDRNGTLPFNGTTRSIFKPYFIGFITNRFKQLQTYFTCIRNTMERPSWDTYFCAIAEVTSKRSPCERLQVGCLLVKENRIISQGYNGFLPGCAHKSIVRDNHEQATVHAEQNALCDCAKRGVSCQGATAYITHYPCIICTRLLLASGITCIKYIHEYKNDELVPYFCQELNVPLQQLPPYSYSSCIGLKHP